MNATYENSNKVDMLQILRAIAALMVLQGHVFMFALPSTGDSTLQNFPLLIILQGAPWVGTWIFFTLSGFLIGKGFYSGRYELTLKSLLAFWRNRALRIIPLYYFGLFIAIVFVVPTGLRQENWLYVLRTFIFTYDAEQLPYNPNGALWFISTLVQFYLIAPFLFWPLRKVRTSFQALMVGIFFIVLGFVLRILPVYYFANLDIWVYWGKYVYKPIYQNLDLFVIGFLANVILVRLRQKRIVFNSGLSALLSIIVLWLVSSFFAVYFFRLKDPDFSIIFVFICPVLTALITFFFIIITESRVTEPAQPISFRVVLRNPLRIFEIFGILSYGIFIWHGVILEAIRPALETPNYVEAYTARLTWGIILSVCMAAITYVTIEKPGAKMKKH